MCKQCGNNKCGGCQSGNNAAMSAQLGNAIQDIATLQSALGFILNGHPTVMIEDVEDTSQFDLVTGIGGGDWTGWGICNGNTYKGVKTLDMRDNFPVGAGGSYNPGDAGGLANVSLTIAQIPNHSHVVNDPGHVHVIVDNGHTHGIIDSGHLHAASSPAHIHAYTTPSAGAHTHQSFGSQLFDTGGGGSQSGPDLNSHNTAFTDAQSAGAHTHAGNTDPASATVVVSSASTGISVQVAATGISEAASATGITITPIGGGLSHENRPPFMAFFFAKKCF